MTLQQLSHVSVGAVMTQAEYEANSSHAGGTGRAADYVIAGSDAPQFIKDQADYICDGTSDEVEFQAAIDLLTAGGKIVAIGTFTVAAPIIKDDNVEIDGVSLHGTSIKAAASTDFGTIGATGIYHSIFETPDLATDIGSNNWFVDTEGVAYGFAIRNLTIDGNKGNSADCGGMALFGKGFSIHNVLIRDCNRTGYYSEAGSQTGQNDYRDLPESKITNLTCRNNGGHGLQIRGAHDSMYTNIVSAFNGALTADTYDEIIIEFSSGAYNGSGIWHNVHTYGNNGARYGLNVGATTIMTNAYIESASDTSVNITANNFLCSNLYITGTAPDALNIDAAAVNGKITNLDINADNTSEIIKLAGDMWHIKGTLSFNSEATVSEQLIISGDRNDVDLNVTNGQATNAQVVMTGAATDNSINFHGNYLDGAILKFTSYTGVRNKYIFHGFKGVNATDWDGTGLDASDTMDYITNTGRSWNRATANITAGANGNATIAHGLVAAPGFYRVTINGDTANHVNVESVDATNLTVRVKDSSGADVTSGTFSVSWEASIQ